MQDSGPEIRYITDVPHKIRKRSPKVFIKLIKCLYFSSLVACKTYCSCLYFNLLKYCNCCARELGIPDSFVLLVDITQYLHATVISKCTSVNSCRDCVCLEFGFLCTSRVPVVRILYSYFVFKIIFDVCVLSIPTEYCYSRLFNFVFVNYSSYYPL